MGTWTRFIEFCRWGNARPRQDMGGRYLGSCYQEFRNDPAVSAGYLLLTLVGAVLAVMALPTLVEAVGNRVLPATWQSVSFGGWLLGYVLLRPLVTNRAAGIRRESGRYTPGPPGEFAAGFAGHYLFAGGAGLALVLGYFPGAVQTLPSWRSGPRGHACG